jgi:hypothetical protein
MLPLHCLALSYVDIYAPSRVPLVVQEDTLYRFRASYKPFHLIINTTVETNGSFYLYEAGKGEECKATGKGLCRQASIGEDLEIRDCVDWLELEIRGAGGKEIVVDTRFGEEVCRSMVEGDDACYTRPPSSCLSPCSCGLLTCQTSRATHALPLFSICLPASTTIEDQLKICQSTRFSITWNFTICPELVPIEVQEKLHIVPIVSQACLAVLGTLFVGMWGVYVVKGKWTALLPDCLFRRH